MNKQNKVYPHDPILFSTKKDSMTYMIPENIVLGERSRSQPRIVWFHSYVIGSMGKSIEIEVDYWWLGGAENEEW